MARDRKVPAEAFPDIRTRGRVRRAPVIMQIRCTVEAEEAEE